MNKNGSRFLSEEEKQERTAALESAHALDDGIRPYLDRLNAIEGVCTTGSCTGHKDDWLGFVWLRLSREMTRLLGIMAFELAMDPAVVEVSKLYYEDGEEHVLVRFDARDGFFGAPLEAIAAFFEGLAGIMACQVCGATMTFNRGEDDWAWYVCTRDTDDPRHHGVVEVGHKPSAFDWGSDTDAQ